MCAARLNMLSPRPAIHCDAPRRKICDHGGNHHTESTVRDCARKRRVALVGSRHAASAREGAMMYRRWEATDEEDELDLLIDEKVDLAGPWPRRPPRPPPTGLRPRLATWRAQIRALIPPPNPATALTNNRDAAIIVIKRVIGEINLALDAWRIDPAAPDARQQLERRRDLRAVRDLLRNAHDRLQNWGVGNAHVDLDQSSNGLTMLIQALF